MVNEGLVLDVLEVAAARRGDHSLLALHVRDQGSRQLGVCALGRITGLQLDGVLEVAGDPRDHLRQLDLERDVMQEIDEHGEVSEHQHQGHGDADVRHEAPG